MWMNKMYRDEGIRKQRRKKKILSRGNMEGMKVG